MENLDIATISSEISNERKHQIHMIFFIRFVSMVFCVMLWITIWLKLLVSIDNHKKINKAKIQQICSPLVQKSAQSNNIRSIKIKL